MINTYDNKQYIQQMYSTRGMVEKEIKKMRNGPLTPEMKKQLKQKENVIKMLDKAINATYWRD